MAKKSKLGSLHLSDWGRGLLMAALVPALVLLEQLIMQGKSLSEVNYTAVWQAAIAGGLGYIIKNLSTNSEGKILKAEPEKKATDNP